MSDPLASILKRKSKNTRAEIPKKIFTESTEEIPETIKVVYKEKINTSQIDEVVKFRLKRLKQNIKLENYIKETKDILEFYKEEKNINVLESYLDICSKYISIERIKNIDKKFKCKGCGLDLQSFQEEEEGMVICPECNCINTYLLPNSYQRDIEKSNYYFDEEINNFIKILDKFEGKTTLILGEEFFEKLDNYFKSINFKTGKEIRKLPLNIMGKKEGTNRKILWTALEKIGFSQYYDEVSYIANIYWGWKLPDLTKYKSQILSEYQKSQKAWSLIKEDYKRTASLGTQFRLFVQLMAVEYPFCERDDFKIQENVESLRLHNESWKRMCEMTNIKYYYVSS